MAWNCVVWVAALMCVSFFFSLLLLQRRRILEFVFVSIPRDKTLLALLFFVLFFHFISKLFVAFFDVFFVVDM